MKFKIAITTVIFAFLLLVSCNSQHIVARTPTLIAQQIPNNSPQPTATMNSTVTPSATFSLAQETQSAMDAYLATIELAQQHFMFTEVPGTLAARNVQCRDGFVLETSLDIPLESTDQWTLFTCSPLGKNGADQWTPGVVDYGTRYTQITKTDFSQTWIIQHKSFDYSAINRPDALMMPYRWTADGRYLYLYPQEYPGGSGGSMSSMLQTWIGDLFRINLETGVFELVLRGNQFYAFALSPDDRFIAYSQGDKPEIIHVKSMETGSDMQIELNDAMVASGPFAWNPESTLIVFAAAYPRDIKSELSDIYDMSSTSIIALTLNNMHAQTILFKDAHMFIPYSKGCGPGYWIDANTICLMSLNNGQVVGDYYFTLNIRSGYLMSVPTPASKSEATLTPTP